MYYIVPFSDLLVSYDIGTPDNDITCEMSTLIAERLTDFADPVDHIMGYIETVLCQPST